MRKDGMTLRERANQVRYDIMVRYNSPDVQIAWNQSQIPAEYGFTLPGPHAVGFLVKIDDDVTVVVPASKDMMMLEGNEENLMQSIGRYLAGLVAHRINYLKRLQARQLTNQQ